MSKQIPLTRGLFAIVDDEDFDRLSAFKWRAFPAHTKTPKFYACRGQRGVVFMHHEVFGNRQMLDHKNRNTLDNRRENLRPCTRSQNQANKLGWASTGFKGVSGKTKPGRFVAKINSEYIGTFLTAQAAARAYDAAARELHGEFAVLNFPDELAAAK